MFAVSADSATRKTLERRFGLDKPLWRQFVRYVFGDLDENGEFVCGLMCGDLGPSYRQRGNTARDMLFKAPEGKPFWQSCFFYSIRLAMLALLLALVFGWETFAIPKKAFYGFGEVAQKLLSTPNFKKSAMLISSDACGEGMFIEEVAMREARPGHYVLRASKVLSTSRWDGSEYDAFYKTPLFYPCPPEHQMYAARS